MKQYILVIVCSVLLIQSHAQVIKPQKITAAQLKELDKKPSINSYTDKISAADKQTASGKVNLLMAHFYKAVLHRSDKSKYPVDNNNAMEKRMAKAVADLPARLYDSANRHVQAALSDNIKKVKDLGQYSDVVFTSGKTLAEQLRMKGGQWEVKESNTGRPKIRETMSLNLLVHSVYCTAGIAMGSDDMVLGGVFFSGGNSNSVANSLFLGEFETGDYASCNDYALGKIDYPWAGSFPQTYYSILVLVEIDPTYGETVEMVNDFMSFALGAVEYHGNDEAYVNSVVLVMRGFTNILGFFEDVMNPFVIKIELKSNTDIYLNDSKVIYDGVLSDTWGTGNILGLGGSYKLALKFRKS